MLLHAYLLPDRVHVINIVFLGAGRVIGSDRFIEAAFGGLVSRHRGSLAFHALVITSNALVERRNLFCIGSFQGCPFRFQFILRCRDFL